MLQNPSVVSSKLSSVAILLPTTRRRRKRLCIVSASGAAGSISSGGASDRRIAAYAIGALRIANATTANNGRVIAQKASSARLPRAEPVTRSRHN